MNKEQTAWLVIRTIGLIFTWKAITMFVGIIYMVYLAKPDGLSSLRQAAAGTFSLEIARHQVFMAVTYGLMAFYFLRRGKSCHNLICSEADTHKRSEDAGSDENDW